MPLDRYGAKRLFDLGFKRLEHEKLAYPQDVYEYNKELWVLGGRIIPNTKILCDEEIIKNGTWIPSTDDLLDWLEQNDCTITLSTISYGYRVEVVDPHDKIFKAKGSTPDFALYNVILKILRVYRGPIITKDIEVIKAELIDIEDLK